ncbi:MAG: GNAT family N-acetyltransferase [Synergistaceae bacterium]|jgi:GNAT superfamily N-acetyltransferase|nr:GNAT family N-acetyltransferase [Synergistaceae bacterium]
MSDNGYIFKEGSSNDIPDALSLRAKLFVEMGVENAALLDDTGARLFEIYSAAYEAREIIHYFAVGKNGETAAVAGALLKRDFPYLFFNPGFYGWIIDVYTEQEHRNRGLATRLLALTHEWLVKKGVREAKLISAGTGPRRLYERLGYRSTWEMSFNLSGEPTYNEFIDANSADNRTKAVPVRLYNFVDRL